MKWLLGHTTNKNKFPINICLNLNPYRISDLDILTDKPNPLEYRREKMLKLTSWLAVGTFEYMLLLYNIWITHQFHMITPILSAGKVLSSHWWSGKFVVIGSVTLKWCNSPVKRCHALVPTKVLLTTCYRNHVQSHIYNNTFC